MAEKRVAALAAEVERLTQALAAAEARVAEVDHARDEARAAEERAIAAAAEAERLTQALAAAERRARAANSRNLEMAGQVLRVTKPVSDSRTQALQAELTAVQAELTAVQSELTAVQSQAHRLNVDIKALHRSTSWRVTAPLRAVRRAFLR